MSTANKPRTAVVTGSASGIGKSLITLLAEDGWIVFAGVRKEADVDILRALHTNIRPIMLDVTSSEQIKQAFENVQTAVGEDGLDALVNNAGMAYAGPCEFTSKDDLVHQFNVNFFGIFEITQKALPLLRLGKPGRIMNVSSLASDFNMPLGGIYCASKAALDSYSECLRREVARFGIKVAVLKPGPVRTNFQSAAYAQAEAMAKRYPPGSPCYEFYGKDLEKYPHAMDRLESAFVTPITAAKVIRTFLNAKTPSNIYYDSWNSYWNTKLLWWTPLWAKDKFMSDLCFAKD